MIIWCTYRADSAFEEVPSLHYILFWQYLQLFYSIDSSMTLYRVQTKFGFDIEAFSIFTKNLWNKVHWLIFCYASISALYPHDSLTQLWFRRVLIDLLCWETLQPSYINFSVSMRLEGVSTLAYIQSSMYKYSWHYDNIWIMHIRTFKRLLETLIQGVTKWVGSWRGYLTEDSKLIRARPALGFIMCAYCHARWKMQIDTVHSSAQKFFTFHTVHIDA